MTSSEYCNSFLFTSGFYNNGHHTDNSHGITCHYFGYMKKGECLLVSDDEKINVSEGDLFYLPKGLEYHSYWKSDDAVLFDSFAFNLIPTTQKYKFKKLYPDSKARAILEELSCNKEISPYSVGLLYSLFSMMMPQMEPMVLSVSEQMVNNAIKEIEKNPFYKMSDIAKALNISESSLYSSFKSYLNKTPNTVRQEICCKRAIDLLQTSDFSVEEISARSGFSSSSYFRKVLFSVTKRTPLQIRNEGKKI